jgi:Ser/Thr protein kinase RdoA (MazF antagonist)
LVAAAEPDRTHRFVFLRSDENRVVRVSTNHAEDIVIKLYRRGRRSVACLQEQHEFLHELRAAGVAVVRPLSLGNHDGIDYAIFSPIDGEDRAVAQYSLAELQRAGRLLGELHAVGRLHQAKHVHVSKPDILAERALAYLLEREVIPRSLRPDFMWAARTILARIAVLSKDAPLQRIHGDAGPWNIRWSADGPVLLDFDDMAQGLAIQDLALFCNDITQSNDESEAKLRAFLDGYCWRCALPAETRSLLQPMRCLRTLQVAAWAVSLWTEPAVRRRHADVMTKSGWERRLEAFVRIAESGSICNG